MKFAVNSFMGVAPRVAPRYLPPGAAQLAINVEAFGQSLRPLRGTTAVTPAVTLPMDTDTIYKFGQNLTEDDRIWINWNLPHDVARSQIAGDGTREWTFWTGGTNPRATYDTLAAQTPPGHIRLGLPAPQAALSGTVGEPEYCEIDEVRDGTKKTSAECTAAGVCLINDVRDDTKKTQSACQTAGGTWTPGVWITGAKESPAKLTLTPQVLAKINSVFGLDLSTNGGTSYKNVKPSSAGAPAMWITSVHLNAMTSSYGLRVSVDNERTWATSTLTDVVTPWAEFWLSPGEVEEIHYQTTLTVSVTGMTTVSIPAASLTSPAALVTALQASAGSLVTAWLEGGGVRVRSVATDDGRTLKIQWAPNAWRQADTSSFSEAQDTFIAAIAAAKINGVALATCAKELTRVVVTSATAGAAVTLVVRWGPSDGEKLVNVGTPADMSTLVSQINALVIDANYEGVTAELDGEDILLTTVKVGKDAKLRVRWAADTTSYLTATGVTSSLGTLETRVYTYTWVLKEAEMEWESAPYAVEDGEDMPSFDVYADGSVTLTGFEVAPTITGNGWGPSTAGTLHQRIYRSVAGTFLYVDEVEINKTSGVSHTYVDNKDADELGEPLPSATWTKPNFQMQGLINLPNGMMAGFYGREVYFCDPYHPFAWPDIYSQSVDYPIVGLGRMDTTLAVLTTGTPYFIQGSAPDMLIMVKSDLEQACVSKRSIVSIGGAVFYASPDGLMMLSSGGSDVLTRELIDRATWQTFNPSSIHAYSHDNQYIAFHAPATDAHGHMTRGFILDLKSKQFIRHSFNIIAAFSHLRNDALYVLGADGVLGKWGEGAYTTDGLWRSKIFVAPQITGLSCAQVEAEAYPVGCRIYRDGVKVVTGLTSDQVTSRDPWRLEAKQGRDWEVELDVKQEIFNVAIAQAPAEIATV